MEKDVGKGRPNESYVGASMTGWVRRITSQPP